MWRGGGYGGVRIIRFYSPRYGEPQDSQPQTKSHRPERGGWGK